jgi:hypothetical protein
MAPGYRFLEAEFKSFELYQACRSCEGMIRQYTAPCKAKGACSWYVHLWKPRSDGISVRYEVFTAVLVKIRVFWVLALCTQVNITDV